MKKILMLLLLIPAFTMSQENSTTEDEYTYLTEGIKEQFSKGLNVEKTGYSLDKFFEKTSTSGKVNFVFSKFIDKNGNIKAISIIMKSENAGPKDGIYYCYPINNEKLLKKHLQKISGNRASDEFIIINSEAMISLLKK